MKKVLSMIIAIVVVVSSITFSPITTSAMSADIEDAIEAEVSDTTKYINDNEIEIAYEVVLYKISIKKTGVYQFYTTGSTDTKGYLVTEEQISNFSSDNSIKYNDDGGTGNNFKFKYYYTEGETAYLAVTGYNKTTGSFSLNVEYYDGAVVQDGVMYEKDYEVSEGVYAWRASECLDDDITKAKIASKINDEAVLAIGECAFEYCYSLSEVEIPEGIISIGSSAFYYCGLKSIKIPESCKYIGYGCFYGTKIKEINIPKNVEEIESLNCSTLEKITVSEENKDYCVVDGVLYSKDKKELVQYPAAKKCDEYKVPEQTEIIDEYSFYEVKNIDKVVLPDSVETIEFGAFSYSKILYIDLGDGLKQIKSYAFEGCQNLAIIDIPESVIFIGYHAFSYIDSITLIIRNSSCELNKDMLSSYNSAVIYGNADSTAEAYADENSKITFIEMNPSGCKADPEQHQMISYYTKVPTCEESGKTKEVCVNCGKESTETVVDKLGHIEEYCLHLCTRCKKIVNKDTIKYVTLDDKLSIVKKDFDSEIDGTIYGFDVKPGTYVIYSSNESLINTYLYFGMENADGELEDIYLDPDMEVTVKEGEKLWVMVPYILEAENYTIGSKLGITCKHAQTEVKTTPATCQKEGKKEEVCASCGKVFSSETIKKTTHDFGNNNEKCSVCGQINPNYKATDSQSAESIKHGNDTYTLNSDNEYVSAKAKKSAVIKLKKGKKSFKVKWKKVANASGYQIQYSTAKNFRKKVTKVKTYQGNKKFTRKIKKLKAGKRYFVRVRVYKQTTVNGNKVKLYSAWSKAKKVVTKKVVTKK